MQQANSNQHLLMDSPADISMQERQVAPLQKAEAFVGSGHFREAMQQANTALESDPTLIRAYEIAYESALATDDINGIITVFSQSAQHCDRRPTFQQFSLTLMSLPEKVRQKVLADMNSAWPQSQKKLDYLCAENTVFGFDDTHALSEVWARAFAGHQHDALSLLDAQLEKLPLASRHLPQLHREALLHLPDCTALSRPIINTPTTEVTCSEDAGTGKVALVFTGLGKNLKMPTPVVDACLAAAGYSTIFIKDTTHCMGLGGIRSLGANRTDTQRVLEQYIKRYDATSVVSIGKSGGGYTALQYGIEMGIDQLLGFSIATCMTDDFIEGIGDTRGQSLRRRLNRDFPASDLDIATLLQQQQHAPAIDLHFGADRQTDARHAQYLQQFDTVTLHPLAAFDGHDTFRQLLITGQLVDRLKALVADNTTA